MAEEVDGGGVGPVDVVDEHHGRRGAHVLEHEVGEGEELAGALALDDLGGGVGERFAEVGAGPLDHRDVGVAPAAGGEGVGDRGEEGVAEGEVGEVEAVVAAAALHRRPPPAGVFERLVGEAGLADARLALDDDEVREPAQREIDAGAQPGKFGPPPDQRARHRPRLQVVVVDRRGRVSYPARAAASPVSETCMVHDVAVALDVRGAEALHHALDVAGVGQRVRHEGGDAGVARALDQRVEQRGAVALSLPRVLHQDADLGRVEPSFWNQLATPTTLPVAKSSITHERRVGDERTTSTRWEAGKWASGARNRA